MAGLGVIMRMELQLFDSWKLDGSVFTFQAEQYWLEEFILMVFVLMGFTSMLYSHPRV